MLGAHCDLPFANLSSTERMSCDYMNARRWIELSCHELIAAVGIVTGNNGEMPCGIHIYKFSPMRDDFVVTIKMLAIALSLVLANTICGCDDNGMGGRRGKVETEC